ATGRSHDEFASYFQGFVDTTDNDVPDAYFVRVYSDTAAVGEYEVVVLRDAEFDRAFLADDWMMFDGSLGYITNVIDVHADPDAADAGAVLDSYYEGVTLSNNYGGSVFAAEADFTTSTGTHVFAPTVSGADGWQSALDELRVDFDVLTDFVSIDAVAKVNATRGFLRGYNSEGVFVEQVLGEFLFPGQTQSLTIQRPTADIAYVVAGGLGPTPVPLDNLVFRAPGGEDVYKLSVIDGDVIEVEGFLPGSGPYEFVNSLGDDSDNDLQLELLAPDGSSLALSGLDGFTHEATKTGVYELVVSTTGRFGEYYVAVDGTTGSNVPIEVTSVTPSDGTLVIGFPETIQVEFSSALDPATIEAGDVLIGGLPASDMLAIDDQVFEFTTDPAANMGFGNYLVEVSADVVSDLLGNSNEPFVSSFEVSEVNPFGRTGIPGSLTSSSVGNTAQISSPEEVDSFSFPIAADETLAAILTPVDATAIMSIAISDGTVYTAAGPGDTVLLPATVVSEAAPITVEVGSDLATEYSIDFYRNVGIHDESLAVNDLTSTFVPLGSGRYAAVGEIRGVVNPPVADIDEFELDLTGKVGTYLDVVVNTVVTGGGLSSLELIHPDGTVAATGSTGGGNFETGILDFEVTQDGVYTVKLIGNGRVEYQLLVAEDLVFDTENGRFPRSLDNASGAFGYLNDLSDTYEVDLNAGDTLTVYTSTPHDQPNNAPRNQLDPKLRVTTPEAETITDSSSLDGINAQIVFEAPVTGTFLIEFSADSGVGEYSLHYVIDEYVPVVDADFNDDGLFDCQDIDSLTAEVFAATNNPLYDLNADGAVDILDRDQWLLDAALANGFTGTYLVGDGNLDGNVDVSDFNLWNARKFSASSAWCDSDFNTDGSVDVSDFNLWNVNKFTSSPTASPTAPSLPRPAGPVSNFDNEENDAFGEALSDDPISPTVTGNGPVSSRQVGGFLRSRSNQVAVRRVARFDHFFADFVADDDDSASNGLES
ncbi:MAG: Ig-like domain-containing protein, partial [Planctomycetota bacterium]